MSPEPPLSTPATPNSGPALQPVPKSVLLVANPAAGSYSADVAADALRLVLEAGPAVDLLLTQHPGHARALARAATGPGRADVLVSLGGDGTAHELMTGLADSPEHPALLVLPGGSGNSLYRELWSDRPWQSVLETALTTPYVRQVDLIRVAETGGTALLGASTGLAAQTLMPTETPAGAPTGESAARGRDRYEKALLDALRTGFPPYPGRVTVDGAEVHRGDTVCANVGGGRYRAGRFMACPRSVLDDGLLDVCVAGTALPTPELLQLARDGRHLGREGVVYARGRRIVLERTDGRPLLFEYDGDLVRSGDATRYTLDVVPQALRVLAPAPHPSADPAD
ncbi:diacylglycerol kinase family protein [Streptomyces sp. NBC_00414]|uniref:diacylglycerol/lipid kinase family protein n=1 Tax=Streptomyces sp. NBC_00414 TaxID=2975739 RepID=UPI002E1C0B44